MDEQPEPHDAHVLAAQKLFRDCGFTLAAMQFKRSPQSLATLKRFNGVSDEVKVPFAWGYHPNEWLARKAGDLPNMETEHG